MNDVNANPFGDLHTERKLDRAVADGVEIKAGDRVVLRPLGRADVFDLALDGKIATVVSIEQDFEDRIHLAVTVDEDPGWDYGCDGFIGHRFFFGIEEVVPQRDANSPTISNGGNL
jgi:hypothetical protein